ncbi:hypothetical protein RUM43_004133 [Polyplax serrata]|uniref:RAP domain-containing protein n=1 Tax=Polyplax serrata TaxID=468196 RepID=A0AAN8SBB9_POLSC
MDAFTATCSEVLGESDLLLEDGMVIQELPVIVRKITGGHLTDPQEKQKNQVSLSMNLVGTTQEREMKEMIEGFDKCYTPKSVFTLLELIPPSEVTPSVALQALKTIMKFESDKEFKLRFGIYINNKESELQRKQTAVSNLIDIIIKSEENSQLLEAAELLSDEFSNQSILSLRQKLCNEVLARVADDRFNVTEVCISAKILLLSGNQFDVDKLWVGVIEKQNEINEKSIMDVVRILTHVNLSRPLFLKILQRQLGRVLSRLSGENIAEILSILIEINEFPYTILRYLSSWLRANILNMNEDDLAAVIDGFSDLPSVNENVVRAIEKFMVEKKYEIRNPELVACIMDYCNKYKIRSPPIFNSCSEYFIENAKYMTPIVLKSIFLPFGNLNFHPPNCESFWRVLEEELMDKLVHLYSEDVLDVMLSFVFLEKHPIKFITKIFNPYFLDRLHAMKDPQHIYIVRTKLKLLDTALTLECSTYKGPLLLPDMPGGLVAQDPRIQRLSDSLMDILPRVLDQDKSFISSVVLKNLPLTELYIVDIVIHPVGRSILFHPEDSWNDLTALLIHLPEHYDSSGKYLVGSQVMRKRHLRCIGLNVVDLNYSTVTSLLGDEAELRAYLKSQLSTAERALPS